MTFSIKNVLIGVLLFGYAPYLFLATSVEKVPNSDKQYNCIASEPQRKKALIGFGAVFYDTGHFLREHEIILPYFNIDEDVFIAKCGDRDLIIGHTDYIKSGDKLHVYTETRRVTLLGKTIKEEEGIFMMGNGWDNAPQRNKK